MRVRHRGEICGFSRLAPTPKDFYIAVEDYPHNEQGPVEINDGFSVFFNLGGARVGWTAGGRWCR